MKLSYVLASAAVVLGATACAAGSPDEAQSEHTGSTQQAMCLNYPDCITKTSSTWGDKITTSSGGLMLDPGTSTSSSGGTTDTFTCDGKASACLDPNNHYLSCNADRTSCVCMTGCGGNGWPYGTYNPCPWYAPNYTCTYYGSCRCY